MLKKTTYNQFVNLAATAPRVVIYQEIYSDLTTPTAVYHKLADPCAHSVLIEFTPRNGPQYAVVALNPMAALIAQGNDIRVTFNGKTTQYTDDPFQRLRELRQQMACADDHPLTKLTGGAIGYLSYDAVRYIEKLPDQHPKDAAIADIDIKFYRDTVTFDLDHHTVFVCHVVDVTDDLDDLSAAYENGMNIIANTIEKIFTPTIPSHQAEPINNKITEFSVDLSDADYVDVINKAKHHISIGDIFQVVPSRTFHKNYHGDAFDVYRALKQVSPSPYHFYLQHESVAIVGASPEKIISVRNNVIDSIPLAGTRPRGHGKSDEQLAAELTTDPKEVAEHVMLVDLARNDIGSVSVPGSVKVSAYLQPVNFSHVIHIASSVQGQLAKNCDVIDVLKATFPAGTLSGAPKIRAMEIIDELEHSRRGIYGGAVIALDRADNLDTCITIRTALIKNNIVYVRAGAGIVHDSNPHTEAQESRQKARSVMSAVQLAEGGLSS